MNPYSDICLMWQCVIAERESCAYWITEATGTTAGRVRQVLESVPGLWLVPSVDALDLLIRMAKSMGRCVCCNRKGLTTNAHARCTVCATHDAPCDAPP